MRAILTLLLLGLAVKALPQVVKAEYFYDNAAVSYGEGISLTVPGNTGNVQITATLPVSSLSPGFHQAFFRVKDAKEGWSTLTPKVFMKPWPLENIVGFKYCIDPQINDNTWIYRTFPTPSANVDLALNIDLRSISKGIHYFQAMARSESGTWTPVSKGTFFNLYAESLNITSLEYYFEADNSSLSPLYTLSDFTPSPEITLDSVTFSLPDVNLENLKSYLIYIRPVDESGNKGFFVHDTIVYHGPTGIKDRIYIAPGLMVFPNPASDRINLKLISLNKAGDFIIRLSDDAGRIVTEKELSFKTDEYRTLEISGFMPGVYRIGIYTATGDRVASAGFIKRK